ncbi:hypothetical protein DEFDS_P238 (plasmid) [Deferribacter desulfuricans SSM1]|uniref:Uncharacterized protein n=1 Tax=Deferribacter desulfuricans (strain DSM 14783 / JCM 11476 / NBRC 101012 / SSM1) TaxID=639282 RepID=D3PF66_DEFDS|nr:hypothetical protein [Deferribacter desulfuricans]BAI81858.1 hypothetical protein DEFDS_P238 [Deferribacter desulfuricans SSM1]
MGSNNSYQVNLNKSNNLDILSKVLEDIYKGNFIIKYMYGSRDTIVYQLKVNNVSDELFYFVIIYDRLNKSLVIDLNKSKLLARTIDKVYFLFAIDDILSMLYRGLKIYKKKLKDPNFITEIQKISAIENNKDISSYNIESNNLNNK